MVIENRQKNFQLQLQLSTFEKFQLQLQQNRVINYKFANHNYNFSKAGKDQKKSYHLSAGPPGTVPYGKSGPGYCITFMKKLDEGLR